MKNKKILIIGGSGFIGIHLTNELLLQGYKYIKIFDKVPPKVKNIEYVLGDISNESLLKSHLKECDIVFVLAAMIGVDNCRNNPELVRKVNYDNTKNLINWIVESNVKRLIFTSSSEVYGNSKDIPYREDSVLDPISVYAHSKVDIENYLKEIANNTSTTVGIVRLFNVYGPGQKKDFVVSIFVNAALKSDDITIFGDGKQTRTFTFVTDVAKGLILLSEYMNTPYEIVNLGSDQEFSIAQLAEKVLSEIQECTSKVQYVKYGEGDVRNANYEIDRRVPSIEKAKKLLSFDARTTLPEGLRETIKSVRKNK